MLISCQSHNLTFSHDTYFPAERTLRESIQSRLMLHKLYCFCSSNNPRMQSLRQLWYISPVIAQKSLGNQA